MRTIIVATDFSPVADNAVEYAAGIAKQTNSKLILYHSFVIPVHVGNTILPASSIQELMDDNAGLLAIKALSISAAYGIETDHDSAFSFIEDELTSLIHKYNAEVLVLGMAPKTLEQDLWGNTTTLAIKKLKFPVLAVPIGAKFKGAKNVLFACDVLTGVSEKVLAGIKQLAQLLNAEVEVFTVDKTVKELQSKSNGIKEIDAGLNGITYYYKNVESGLVIEEIEKEIIEFKADLLIMVPKKYGFWSSLVHKSKTRMMASGLDIPLLSIPV